MSRIDRYILREVGIPLMISTGLVVALVFLIQTRKLATAALGMGLTLEDVLVILVSALPPFLVLAVPIALLLSVLVGLGRLSQDLELIAMSAAGASPWRCARAPLVLGALVSLLCLPLAIFGEPYGLSALHSRLIDLGLRNLTRAIKPGRFNEDFRGNAIYAGARQEDGALLNVFIFDERDQKNPVLVTSQRGIIQASDQVGIVFTLFEGEIHLGQTSAQPRYDRLRFESAQMRLNGTAEVFKKARFVSPLGQMTNERILKAVKIARPVYRRKLLKTYWRRFAFPTMAFVFGVIGAAIGLSAHARSRGRNALLGILAVIGYYVLTRIADFAVLKYDNSAFIAAWVPNLVVLALGLIGLQRAGRPR